MTDTLLEQIKADRESGTPGPWVFERLSIEESMMGKEGEWNISAPDNERLFGNCPYYPYVSENEVDARRIARVPDLEAAYIALTEARARDAETIKAAEALADCLTKHRNKPQGLPSEVFDLLAAFRAAQEKNDG